MRVGPYELLDLIGRGGMGTVHRARHVATGEVVAVKVMAVEQASDPVMLRRFEQEFAAARRCRHPGIVQGLDFGVEEGVPYLVMEYVAGQSLGQRIRRHGPLSEVAALRQFAQLAEALAHAHAGRLVHRDVKPDNILLADDGRAMLADLGLIKDLAIDTGLTRSRTMLGTVAYMAPEQFEDAKHADARCDIYGLAASLYFALTGMPPFQDRGNLAILSKKLRGQFAPPRQVITALHERIDALICRSLLPDVADRPASCIVWLNTLLAVLAQREAEAVRPAPSVPSAPNVENRRVAPRFTTDLPASCGPLQAGRQRWHADIQDVSLTGVRLLLERRFEPGVVLNIEVHDDSEAVTSALLVRIRWVRSVDAGGWAAGCSFTRELSTEELEAFLAGRSTTVMVPEITAPELPRRPRDTV